MSYRLFFLFFNKLKLEREKMTEEIKLNKNKFHCENRDNFIGAYIVDEQSGVWSFTYWSLDKKLHDELKAKNYNNVVIMSDVDNIVIDNTMYYITIIDYA